MEGAHEELERRSKFLNSLIQKKKDVEHKKQNDRMNVRVRASDMPLALQNHAFRFARDNLDSMASGKLDSKRLALALKKVVFDVKFSTAVKVFTERPNYSFYIDPDPGKFLANGAEEFDSTYGPAWHCIVGTSFGSYVTHSVGGFLYFSMDNVYILLFKTAVEPLDI